MPNIEIHGLSRWEARNLRGKIFNLFQGRPYVDEMIVTIYENIVTDKNGEDQPFIRLANSHQLHTVEILGKLKTLDLDIEHLKLAAFIPKKKQEKEGE